MCLTTWKTGILRAKNGVYLTKKIALDNVLDNEKIDFFFSFFYAWQTAWQCESEPKNIFHSKKIKKIWKKHEKSENVRKV